MNIVVLYKQCDEIQIEKSTESVRWLKLRGCLGLLEKIANLRGQNGQDPSTWPLPEGSSHVEMLVRELILKSRGEWNFPYEYAEVCHCRNVTLRKVDDAVLSGAHQSEVVSQLTLASTACGTCRIDVERIIGYRLNLAAQEAEAEAEASEKKSA